MKKALSCLVVLTILSFVFVPVYAAEFEDAECLTTLLAELSDETEDEVWIRQEFEDGNFDGWEKASNTQLSSEDGCLNISGSSQGWILNRTEYEGGQIYKLVIRAKIENVTKPTDYSMPRFRLYYSGVGADGSALAQAEARAETVVYNSTKNEDGTFSSDWEEYTIDLSAITDFATAEKITAFRIDTFKNSSAGTVYIDWIRMLSKPCIQAITYDGGNSAQEGIACDAETFELTLSQPFYKIPIEAVKICDVDGNTLPIKAVNHVTDDNSVIITLNGMLYSASTYRLIITQDAYVTSAQKLYGEIAKTFQTTIAEVDLMEISNRDGTVLLDVINQSGAEHILLLTATFWNGDRYAGKKVTVIQTAERDTEIALNYGAAECERMEVSLLEIADDKIITHGSRIFIYEN